MPMKRRGIQMRLIIDDDATTTSCVDLPLRSAIARAYRWVNDLLTGRAQSIGDIAERERLTGTSRAPAFGDLAAFSGSIRTMV
jgi:hypothetical protein